MREIEFKVWDIRESKFIDVYSICPKGRYVHVAEGDHYYLFNSENEEPEFILCQYTGVTDKNGVKIFEGDIIEYVQHHFNTEMVKVKRKLIKWNFDKWNVFETAAGESNIEIIGNIYQHSELLNNE
jgi:uncharacterized phage protein (TIGR01671 family)